MTTSSTIPADLKLADDSRRDWVLSHLDEFDAPSDNWTLVKKNASRSVYCREIDGTRWYLKHFHGKSVSHTLRRWLKKSEAYKEFAFSARLRENRIAAQTIFAARFDPSRKLEWALSEEITDAQPLNEWHATALAATELPHKAIKKTTRALAKLVGKMHAAGILHNDLHCGNILRKSDGKLILMDLHRMGRCGWVARRKMAANLSQLLHDRKHLTHRSQRLRFLRDYLEFNTAAHGSLRGWQWLVGQLTRRYQKAFFKKRDRRIRGNNNYFTSVRLGNGWRGRVILASKRHLAGSKISHNEYTKQDWLKVLANPSTLFDGPDVTVVKNSPTTTVVRRTLEVDGRKLDVFIKRNKIKTPLKRLLSAVRTSKALLAFTVGHELLNRHIPTALPVCALDRRRGLFVQDSILITETVEASLLDAFMDRWLGT